MKQYEQWRAEVRERVFLAIGEASMCWSETPSGVFDDQRASRVAEELLAALIGKESTDGNE